MAEEFQIISFPTEPPKQLTTPIHTQPQVNGTDTFRVQRIFHVLQKHWRLSVLFATTFMAALIVITFLMRDTYEARARIEIESPPGPTSFTLRETANAGIDEQTYMETQIEILKSDILATLVIQKLRLEQNTDFVRKSHSYNPKNQPVIDEMEIALTSFRNQLTVEEVRNSRLVEVVFSSHNPELAAQVTNELVNLYLERSYRAQYEAVTKASQSLSPEMEDLRQQVEKANQAVVDFQNAAGIVEVGNGDYSQPNANNGQTPVTQRIGELNRQLTQAQTDRIQQEAYLKMIQAGSADSLPQMRDNPVLQDILKRYVESQAQQAQAMAVFGQNNPNAKKLQNQVDELKKQLSDERRRIVEQVKTGFQAALAHEELLAQALTGMQGSVERMNKDMLQYNELKRRAQVNSELYNVVSTRLKEAALAGSLNSNNIRVVDSARRPRNPAKPNRLEIISLGIVFSILGAAVLAFVKETFDDNIYTSEDIWTWTALPSLAMLPLISSLNSPAKLINLNGKNVQNGSRLKFFLERPSSEEAEAVRSLVISIRSPNGPSAKPARVILLVSPFPNEGKTTVAVNLAIALAQHGKTCLVDANLRIPAVARTFGLPSCRGLSDVLKGPCLLNEVLKYDSRVPNLTILPVGSAPPNPGELVSSERMRHVLQELRESFDHVVIDSPPMIPYADARSLSATADGVVLVARCGLTKQRALARSAELLKTFHVPVLGVVLNGVDPRSGYYYGYGSYRPARGVSLEAPVQKTPPQRATDNPSHHDSTNLPVTVAQNVEPPVTRNYEQILSPNASDLLRANSDSKRIFLILIAVILVAAVVVLAAGSGLVLFRQARPVVQAREFGRGLINTLANFQSRQARRKIEARQDASGVVVTAMAASAANSGSLEPEASSTGPVRIEPPTAPVSTTPAPDSPTHRVYVTLGSVSAPIEDATTQMTSSKGLPVVAAEAKNFIDNNSVLASSRDSSFTKPGAPAIPVADLKGKLQQPKLISSPSVVYPPRALAEQIQGTVTIDALIDAIGSVADMRVIAGPALLHPAAMRALSTWKYEPARLNGEPIALHIRVSMDFRLQEQPPYQTSLFRRSTHLELN